MAEKKISYLNFRKFMMNNAQANIAIKKYCRNLKHLAYNMKSYPDLKFECGKSQ